MNRPTSDAQRIVFNGRFLAQVQTGVQRYAAETLVALDALLSESPALGRGLRFELVVPEDAAPLELRHVTTVRTGGRGGHVWEQLALWRAARGAYLVNFNYSGPLLKRRQLVTIHDATVPVMPQAFSRSYRWLHHTLVAILGRSADSVMTISNFSRDEIARCFGLRRRDVVVGCEGGEHAVHVVDDHAVLKKHGLSPRAYVLGVGSVKPNKNFGLIGQAMKLLPDYPWPVAIAGAKDIGIFRDASVLPDGFRFLGFVPDEDLSALYRQAACFVFPSSYEGFGLPAVEAMANGCPVLAASAASIPEVCGDAALYFDADDPIGLARAMHRMHEEPALRETLVRAGYERLRHYNWPSNAHILLNHLKQRIAAQTRDVPRASASKPDSVPASPRHSSAMTITMRMPTDLIVPTVPPLPSSSPRILHATECLAAGTMNFLIQATRELAEAGVQQTLLYSRRPDTPEDFASRFDARVTLIELPPLRAGVLRYFRSLRRHLLDARLDKQLVAVHLHSSKAGFLGRMALAGTGPRPPLFYSPHGLSFLDRRLRIPGLMFHALEWLAARVHGTLVGCSRGEAKLLARISPRSVKVLENAVDDSFFQIQRQPSAPGASAAPPMVVSMGRICYQKAPERFAELAARFQIAEVPARFVWIGGGSAAGEAALRASGVEVTGWLSSAQVQHWLSQADVYVQTSRWEGMPLSVLQALAAGVPCVTTNVVGNRDAVRQGFTGYAIKHHDELVMTVLRLVRDSALRERFSQAARTDAAARFSGESFRQRLLELYGLNDPHAPAVTQPKRVPPLTALRVLGSAS